MASRQSVWPMRVALVAAAAAAVVVAVLWIGALRGRSAGRPAVGSRARRSPRRSRLLPSAPCGPRGRGARCRPRAAQARALAARAPALRRRHPGRARLEVKQGRAAFAVAPVRSGQRFAVQTRQVVVSVLGTRFSVDVRPRCTRVEVQRGRVRAAPLRGRPSSSGRARSARSATRSTSTLPAGRCSRPSCSPARA